MSIYKYISINTLNSLNKVLLLVPFHRRKSEAQSGYVQLYIACIEEPGFKLRKFDYCVLLFNATVWSPSAHLKTLQLYRHILQLQIGTFYQQTKNFKMHLLCS